MRTVKGTLYYDFYHPTQDDVHCGVEIRWSHTYSPPSQEEPGDDDINIDNLKVVTYCGDRVSNMEVPEWITNDDVYNVIDPIDYYDGNDN
jgi:hypothetical protein